MLNSTCGLSLLTIKKVLLDRLANDSSEDNIEELKNYQKDVSVFFN